MQSYSPNPIESGITIIWRFLYLFDLFNSFKINEICWHHALTYLSFTIHKLCHIFCFFSENALFIILNWWTVIDQSESSIAMVYRVITHCKLCDNALLLFWLFHQLHRTRRTSSAGISFIFIRKGVEQPTLATTRTC